MLKSDMLDEEENHQLRGLAGQLNWVCKQTRPASMSASISN